MHRGRLHLNSNEIAKGILKAVGILCVPVGGIWLLSAMMAGASEDARVALVLMSLLVALIAGSVICAAFRDGLAGVGMCLVGWMALGVVCGAGFYVSVLRFNSRGPLEVPWWAWAALVFGLALLASWCSWRREKWDQRKWDAKPMTRGQKLRAGGSELVSAVVGLGCFGVLGWMASVYLPSWDAITNG